MRRIISLLLTLLLVCSLLPMAFAAEELPEDCSVPKKEEEAEALDPKVEAMLAWALEIAEDDTHGYSQAQRYGPNYDCSSFVSTALMVGFGLDKYLSPAGMVTTLPEYGFAVYRRGETVPQRGDIITRPYSHVEICMGDGACVGAHQDYNGRSGDGNGHEIEYRLADSSFGCPFCNKEQYTYILRYERLEIVSEISNSNGDCPKPQEN